jgi:hypothetical protein
MNAASASTRIHGSHTMTGRNGVSRWLPALLAALAVTACASGARVDEGAVAAQAAEHVITVRNDHESFTEVLIFVIPTAGIQQLLGTVAANETRSFAYSAPRGPYRLLARRPSGDSATETFHMPGSARVEWRTSQRRALVRGR